MTGRPLVSIVVNNYNYARFVAEAIQSALDQSYRPTEVIVVDDGSSDASRAVIASFGTRIEPVFKRNGGQASALNAGFARSRGAIVVFLDADDWLRPHALAKAARLFDSGVVKVHWQLEEVDDAGRSLGRLHKGRLIEGCYREEVIRRGPVSLSQSPTSGNAWARRFLETVMPLPEHEDRHGADGFLKRLCPIYGLIRKLEEPLGCYRIHDRSYGGGAGEIFKLRRSLSRYPAYCRLLAEHLQRQGVEVNVELWMGRGSQYEWLRKAVALHDELPALLGRGEVAVLVDGDALGCDFHGDRELLPFLERNGAYWGPPADDAEALAELDRMRQQGAACLLLAFPAFWWLEAYPGLRRRLEDSCRCRSQSERARVYELTRS